MPVSREEIGTATCTDMPLLPHCDSNNPAGRLQPPVSLCLPPSSASLLAWAFAEPSQEDLTSRLFKKQVFLI